MTRVFFPGCKVKRAYPEASEKLKASVIEQGWADEVTGCCRVNHQKLTEEDTAVVICNNCSAMIDEDANNKDKITVWELIDSASDFPFPDYDGRTMALQDCGRAYDRPEVHDSIRSILKKMNIDVVELNDAREKCAYCGISAYRPVPKQDGGFAPKRYVEDAPKRGMFV